MVLFDRIAFHNVYELTQEGALPGWAMRRFPERARNSVNHDAADFCRGVELRFCLEKPRRSLNGTVYLMARGCDGEATVFYGDYQQPEAVPLPKGVITPVTIRYDTPIDGLPPGRFANDVRRICITSRTAVNYVGREALNCRPPRGKELPRRTLVGYGSSITNGGLARSCCNSYLHLTARALGMDALNLGLSGSCMATREMADFMACEVAGDVFFLELGANMLGSFSAEEYRERVRYTTETVARGHPHQPVYVTALYPSIQAPERNGAYARALHEAVEALRLPNLLELDAWALLPTFDALTTDGVHPSDWGHMLIASRLSERLRKDEAAGKWNG